jgi:hypothetical protein
VILDVFWGRRSKVYHGIKDGGAKAIAIGNPNIAQVHNGNSIFNVNDPSMECQGGHFHTPKDPNEVCFEFDFTDWVNNKITIIATGVPGIGQIGPHNQTSTCMSIITYKKIDVPSIDSFKMVDVEIIIDSATKNIILRKSPLPSSFSGKVVIDAK